jgi:hypothetical protein
MGYLFNLPAGSAVDGSVATFADLPSAGANNGKIYIVKQTTGVVLVNRKRSGLYLSDGASWTRLAENNSFLRTAATSGNDNRLYKSDGTGGNEAQQTGITVDDSDNVSGIGSISADTSNMSGIFTAGESITAGDLLYLNTDGKVYKAFATGTVEESTPLGFAQSSVAADATLVVRIGGVEDALSSLSSGVVYYVSTTAGAITSTAPSGSGDNIVRIGVSQDSTTLFMTPQYMYTKD